MFLNVHPLYFFRDGLMLEKSRVFFQDHRLYIGLIVLIGIFYWISIPFKPYWGSILVKWLPIGLLTGLAWYHRKKPHVTVLTLALLFHGIGDIIIELEGENTLLLAILPFLIGHLLYALTFQKDRNDLAALTVWEKGIIVIIITYGLFFGIFLSFHLQLLYLLAVIPYIIVILSMVLLSVMARYTEKIIVLGALLYVISDSLIALTTFVMPWPWSPLLTWPTYFFGQLFITVGYLSEKTVVGNT